MSLKVGEHTDSGNGRTYTVYHLIREGEVDPDALLVELEEATGLVLHGDDQEGFLVTAKIVGVDETIAQVRIPQDGPRAALTPSERTTVEQAIAGHVKPSIEEPDRFATDGGAVER